MKLHIDLSHMDSVDRNSMRDFFDLKHHEIGSILPDIFPAEAAGFLLRAGAGPADA